VTAVPAEVDTHDEYRASTITPTGAISYRYGEQHVDVNSGAVTSPITNSNAGTTTAIYLYQTPAPGKKTFFHTSPGATWSDTNVPFSVTYTNAEVATFQLMADSSTSFQ